MSADTPLTKPVEKKTRNGSRPAKNAASNGRMTGPKKLLLLFVVVNREKSEFYEDYLQTFEVNLILSLPAQGTAPTEALNMLGLSETNKTVIVGVIRESKVKAALNGLDEKFRKIRNGRGIAFVVPMTSTIGVTIYQFLVNSPAT